MKMFKNVLLSLLLTTSCLSSVKADTIPGQVRTNIYDQFFCENCMEYKAFTRVTNLSDTTEDVKVEVSFYDLNNKLHSTKQYTVRAVPAGKRVFIHAKYSDNERIIVKAKSEVVTCEKSNKTPVSGFKLQTENTDNGKTKLTVLNTKEQNVNSSAKAFAVAKYNDGSPNQIVPIDNINKSMTANIQADKWSLVMCDAYAR